MAKNKSILRDGYMAAVLAELKRDAGKLWVEPFVYYFKNGLLQFAWDNFRIFVDCEVRAQVDGELYTPARFRAALRRIKQKGGGK